MTILKNLLNVQCARCQKAGHRCQAQIVTDDGPLCLRCADDEPCIYVTAAGLANSVARDLFAIPAVSAADRKAIRDDKPEPPPAVKLDQATKDAILKDRKFSAAQLARKFGIQIYVVRKLRAERNRQRREAYSAMIRERRLTAIETQIGAETVRIAPAAVFGAEMLEARQDEPKK